MNSDVAAQLLAPPGMHTEAPQWWFLKKDF